MEEMDVRFGAEEKASISLDEIEGYRQELLAHVLYGEED